VVQNKSQEDNQSRFLKLTPCNKIDFNEEIENNKGPRGMNEHKLLFFLEALAQIVRISRFSDLDASLVLILCADLI